MAIWAMGKAMQSNFVITEIKINHKVNFESKLNAKIYKVYKSTYQGKPHLLSEETWHNPTFVLDPWCLKKESAHRVAWPAFEGISDKAFRFYSTYCTYLAIKTQSRIYRVIFTLFWDTQSLLSLCRVEVFKCKSHKYCFEMDVSLFVLFFIQL